MIRENRFGVRVLGQEEIVVDRSYDHEYVYVALKSGTKYKLELSNRRDTMCDALVELEGERVGMWRIHARDSIVIERPADTQRKFTFFSEDSPEARRAGVRPGSSVNGLVKVTFYPKKRGVEVVYESIPRAQTLRAEEEVAPSFRAARYSSGATVLGDRSDQQFRTIPPLRPEEIDWSEVTEIVFRLIAREDRPRYVSVANRRKSRTPPRID